MEQGTGDRMTDWYYHDPAQGRVGPLSAEQLRNRYADRRIQRDTLAWHAGVREWQPLDRFSEELQLDAVVPDASLPPPLPPPQAAMPSMAASMHASRPHLNAAPRRRGLSGCAIAAIVLAAVSVPVLAILAAIAIPAYNDYTIRAKSTAGLVGAAAAMKRAVAEHVGAHGRCPGNDDFAPLLKQFATVEKNASVQFGTLANGHCAFEFTLHGVSSAVEGKTWLYEARRDGDVLEWDCSGGDLPARYRPAGCRAQ
jgi:type IV pilus assembly protein PilA